MLELPASAKVSSFKVINAGYKIYRYTLFRRNFGAEKI